MPLTTRAGTRRAFTLFELVAVFVIIGLVTIAGAVTFRSVTAAQADMAGGPVLAAAQAQARRVAALDHYRWSFAAGAPTPSAALAAAMSRGAGPGTVTFTDGPSGGDRSVSVAWADAAHVTFAVATQPGHCLLMVDSLTEGTSWVRDPAAGADCSAAAALAALAQCPEVLTGSSARPGAFAVADPCRPPAAQPAE